MLIGKTEGLNYETVLSRKKQRSLHGRTNSPEQGRFSPVILSPPRHIREKDNGKREGDLVYLAIHRQHRIDVRGACEGV